MRLSSQTIAKLSIPAGKSELLVFDDAVPGFGIRLRQGGKRVWVVQYRVGAKQRRVTLGSVDVIDPEQARRIAKTTLAKAQLGTDPQAEKAETRARAALTLGTTVETYITGYAEGRLKAGSLRDVARYLRVAWKPLHELPLHKIDRRAVAARLAEIAADSGKVTANRARTTLSSFFSWAIREGIADTNPTVGTNTFEEKSRDRVLSDDELRLIWEASGERGFGSIVRLLMLTGQRRLEIGGLRADEVDLPGRQIRLPASRTKNGRPHDVHLSASAIEIVQDAVSLRPEGALFGAGDGPFQGWSKCKERLDRRVTKLAAEAEVTVAPWTLHDLRRTVATRMGDLGVQPHVVEAVLNHVSGHKGGVAGIYNRAQYAAEKRQALDIWGSRLASIASGKADNVHPLAARAS